MIECEWTTNSDVVHSVASSTRSAPFGSGKAAPPPPPPPPPKPFLCADKWREAWFGNATVGGVWNNTVEKLSKRKEIIGVYFGDELLVSPATLFPTISRGLTVAATQGGIITIQNLTSIFGYVKSAWPDGITYYNDQWDVFNDPTWRDGTGEKYGMVPSELDWISYDVSWKATLCRVACVEGLNRFRCAQFYRLNNASWLQPMCECE